MQAKRFILLALAMMFCLSVVGVGCGGKNEVPKAEDNKESRKKKNDDE